MNKTFSKYNFFIIFGLFFLIIPFAARAEVTCCACTRTAIDEMGREYATGSRFDCQEGILGCAELCARDSEVSRPIGDVRATGEVVTCCECANAGSRICTAANQICDTLCSSNGGFRQGGLQIQRQSTGETTKDEASKVELIPPNLNIDIPGAGNLFGGGQIVTEGEERYFYLPYIGEYVSALYNYVLGIVGILAVVVIIFAGGIWLTAGGSPERIKTAQEYIFGAVTGVVLAFGSYLILYTINPDLVRFDAMKVKVVERINFEFAFVLATTEANTMEQDGNTTFVTSINTDEYESRFTSCPFTLPAPLTNPTRDQINFNPRTIAFIENIMPILRETTE